MRLRPARPPALLLAALLVSLPLIGADGWSLHPGGLLVEAHAHSTPHVESASHPAQSPHLETASQSAERPCPLCAIQHAALGVVTPPPAAFDVVRTDDAAATSPLCRPKLPLSPATPSRAPPLA